jgi:aspartate-semialdehyde dehydrogenase
VGSEVSFGDGVLKVKALDYYDFKGTDIALMSAGGEIAKQWAPKIAAQGCMVIDNSSAWRMDRQVPLVVPEVNADALNDIPKGIIANPNCSTAQLVVAEAAARPVHHQAGSGFDLSVGLRRRQGNHGRVVPSDPCSVRGRSHRGGPVHQTIAFNVIPISVSSWIKGSPRKNGKWRWKPRRSWTPISKIYDALFVGAADKSYLGLRPDGRDHAYAAWDMVVGQAIILISCSVNMASFRMTVTTRVLAMKRALQSGHSTICFGQH